MAASCLPVTALTLVLLLAPAHVACTSELWVVPASCDQLDSSASSEGSGPISSASGSGGVSLMTLDDALQLVESDTVVYLESGIHCVKTFVLLHGWNNISLVGEPEAIITCEENLGLAFVNITKLRLENLRIDRCGLSKTGLNETVSLLKNILDLFVQIPPEVRIALLLGHVHNLVMENMNVTNTRGFGMVAINIMGESEVRNAIFFNNAHTDLECRFNDFSIPLSIGLMPSLFGGGAYFIYQDYLPASAERYMTGTRNLVKVDSTAFYDNSDCSFVVTIALGYRESAVYQKIGYTIGGGGGLSVVLAQREYGVDVVISNSTMVNNTARFGGGAAIVTFTGVTNSHVVFRDNCTFISNGFPTLDFFTAVVNSTFAAAGGALAVFFDATPPGLPPVVPSEERNVSVEIFDSLYVENAAYIGGAVIVYSFFTSTVNYPDHALAVRFVRCHFKANAAVLGAAMWVYELKTSARYQYGLQLELQDIIALANIGTQANSRLTRRVQDNPAIIDVRSVNVTLTGSYISICDNEGTALQASGSLIGILGENCTVLVQRNTGVYGGGFNLLQMSYLIVQPETYLYVVNNTARIQGGAFYINLLGSNSAIFFDDCFLYFSYQHFYACVNCSSFNDIEFHIFVSGNSAPKGNTLYGSALVTCPWAQELQKNYDGGNILEILSTNFPERFNFSSPPISREEVITPPNRVEIQADTGEGFSIAPGEALQLNVSATDSYNQTVSTVIESYVISSSGNDSLAIPTTRVGGNGFAVIGDQPTSTRFRVFSEAGKSVNVALYSVEALGAQQASFDITIESCPLGFVFNTTTQSCACVHELEEEGINCNVDELLIIVPDDEWVGPVGEHDDRLVVEECILTYCISGEKTIDLRSESYDVQCNEDSNRGGLLCGRCQTGYSIVLGGERCFECSNANFALIVLFLALGILLVILISYLRITITGGFLNGVLLYSNLVNLFEPILTPMQAYDGRLVLTSFLSLNVGVEICFYDKMDALQKIWWQLSFPLYLHILMLVITVTTKCCKWERGAGFSIIQAFATLSILSYVSVVVSCVELLGAVAVHTVSGDTLIRWLVDPTVTYFEAAHGALAFVAIVLLIFYIIPLPIFLLFPSLLYRAPLLQKFKPLYDAFFAPFKPKFRFWLGFRLMFRWLPLVMYYLVPYPVDTFVTAVALLFLLCAQIKLEPFKDTWRNLADSFFLLNLVLLFFGAVFFEANEELVGKGTAEQQGTAFSTFLVAIAYVGFAVVLCYHIIVRFPTLKERLEGWTKRMKEKEKPKVFVTAPEDMPQPEDLEPADETNVVNIEHKPEKTVATTNQSGDVVKVNFTVLREPLLEEGSVHFVTIPPSPREKAAITFATKDKKKRKGKKETE